MHDSKTRILNAASSLFLKGGVSALTVRKIAERAGLSTIGIYSHFQGKQGILDALYIEGFNQVSAAMDVVTENIEPRNAVLRAGKNYLQTAERFEAHYRLIFGQADDNYTPSADANAVGAKAFRELHQLVALLLPKSSSSTQTKDAALQVWAIIHGYVSLKHHAVANLVDMSNWKEQAMNALELLIDGIENTHRSMQENAGEKFRENLSETPEIPSQ